VKTNEKRKYFEGDAENMLFIPIYTGKTSLIKDFKSKAGKSFDASLKFDDNFQVVFDFYAK
jgi:hypothetical protein